MSQQPKDDTTEEPENTAPKSVLPDIVIDKTNGTRIELELSPLEWTLLFAGAVVILTLSANLGLI